MKSERNKAKDRDRKLTRRTFMTSSAAAAAFTIASRSVLGGHARPAPSERITRKGQARVLRKAACPFDLRGSFGDRGGPQSGRGHPDGQPRSLRGRGIRPDAGVDTRRRDRAGVRGPRLEQFGRAFMAGNGPQIPAGSRRILSNKVRSENTFWNVKYSLSASGQTCTLTLGWVRIALISDANRNRPAR